MPTMPSLDDPLAIDGVVAVGEFTPDAKPVDYRSRKPQPDAILEGLGEACATLTPLIWRRIRRLESGQVLEVISDDPAAREGVAAWSRLTGHRLLETIAEPDGRSRFYLGRK